MEQSSYSLTVQLGWMVWGQVLQLRSRSREGGNGGTGRFLLCDLVTPQRKDVFKTGKLLSVEFQSHDLLKRSAAEMVFGANDEAHGG